MKVAELREELGKRGLDTTGLKKALVKRLQTALKAKGKSGGAGAATGASSASASASSTSSSATEAEAEPTVSRYLSMMSGEYFGR